ncbi:MAG: hypothetical protein ACLQEQ_02595 [Nitrososphaerales archaeon]
MPSVSDILKSNLAYEFIAVGVVWAAIAVGLSLAIVLWPALTCLVAGLLLRLQPSARLTWPWATSSAALGLLVSGYQAYVAVLFINGTFSLVAGETLAAFTVFALVHLMLLYTGYSPAGKPAV